MGIKTFEIDSTSTATTWTEQARDEFARMGHHVQALATAYGPTSKQATDASASLARVLSSLVGWGDVSVHRDGHLSLICNQKGGMVFGLIWHGVRRGCTRDVALGKRCHAVINDDGKAWTYMPGYPVCEDGKHVLTYPLDAPAPGTWSFHS